MKFKVGDRVILNSSLFPEDVGKIGVITYTHPKSNSYLVTNEDNYHGSRIYFERELTDVRRKIFQDILKELYEEK